jgi:hypothetical protein
MPTSAGPDIVQNGLVLDLDAADRNSYVSGSTTWFDLSGNPNNGTLTNGPTYSSANGGSIVFDGTNDLIIKNPPFTGLPSSQLSVFIWIKFNSLSAVYYELVSQGRTPSNYEGEWVLITNNVSSSVRLSFFDYNSGYGFNTVNGNTILVTNQWYYLGFIKNGTSGTFYVQGSQDGTSTGINKTYTDTGYVIGGGYRDSSHYLSGNLASTQIYNRALSAAEVAQNYNAQKSRFGL